jgi:putative cardiolipin synthase
VAGPIAALLFLTGCTGMARLADGLCERPSWECVTSTPVFSEREPVDRIGNPPKPDAIAREFDARLKTLVAADRAQRIEKANGIALSGLAPSEALPGDHHRRYRQVTSVTAGFSGGRLAPVRSDARAPEARTYDREWRLARQTLYLGGRPAEGGPKLFRFSAMQTARSEIGFRSIAESGLTVSGSCDGPARLTGKGGGAFAAGAAFRFVVAARESDERANQLVPGPGTTRCDLTVTGGSGPVDRIRLLRETAEQKAFAGIDGRYDACPDPDPAGLTALGRVFYADRWLSQTCVMKSKAIRLLHDPREGFNAKVEALLGRRLSDAAFDAGDPEMALDFSNAPEPSLIYASYLDIKADFSGTIFTRLLRHHAERGVPIRVIVTEILERRKDRAMLERLVADHPNVQLQEFAWQAPDGSAYDEQFSQFHKTHHVKLLAVLTRQPGRSRAILGGRNIHDGFLYKEPLDLSRFPDLHTYSGTNGLSLNYYSNYRDFDIEISDAEAVRTLAAHFSTLWHRDYETNVSPPFSVHRAGGPAPRGYRHFISVPYADGRALERYYVELIDAAQDKIEIVNPYLNPPPEIEAALERAIRRGVRVIIVARINLKGDLGGTVLTRLNELFVEKYGDRVELFEYKEPKVVLHSKLLMIDETLSVVSSVNLNHRSFIHDSENGIAIYDPSEYRRIKAVFDLYRSGSVPIDGDVDIPLRYRMLLGIDLLTGAM